MKNNAESKKEAYKILISCCLFYGALAGILVNCNGQFYASIAESLRVSLGDITISSAIMGISSLLFTPFAVKIYREGNARAVICITVFIYSLSYMMTIFVNHLWQYYLISILRGAFQGFLIYFLVSSLIKAWFAEKSGMALSITAFSSGITGIVSNLLIGLGISYIGWKNTLSISCFLTILIALPGMCLYLYRSPEEKDGTVSKGNKENKKYVLHNEISSIPIFLLGLLLMVLLVLPYSFIQHLKVYAITEGFSQMVGASLLSISMAGNILSKFLLSIICDRLGARKSAEAVLIIIMIGFIFLLLPSLKLFLYAGAFLLGASASIIPIIIPQITNLVYKGKAFDVVYSKYSTVLSMASAVWVSMIGLLYSLTGSYRLIFAGGLFLTLASVGLLNVYIKNKKKA